MDLKDRAALVTGGKRVGIEVALALARQGADVALTYNKARAEAEQTAGAVQALGRRAVCIQVDLTDAAASVRAVNAAAAALGRLHVLVHMASLYVRVPFDALTVDVWDRSLAVDLRSAFLCATAAAPHMRAAKSGRIILFSDWVAASRRPRYHGYLPYYVAKSGVVALTEALALELAADNILVNAIAPGPILAPGDITESEVKAVEEATPLGRWGGTAEVAKAVIALIESDFITGETIRVDGGRHLR
jgi:NAD(P)-dependent dehydrogenase (short-subunit alcohol dehydrogenase family)